MDRRPCCHGPHWMILLLLLRLRDPASGSMGLVSPPLAMSWAPRLRKLRL